MQQVGIDIALSTHIPAAGEVLSYIRKGSVVSISYLEGARVQAAEVILQTGAPACGRSPGEACPQGMPRRRTRPRRDPHP